MKIAILGASGHYPYVLDALPLIEGAEVTSVAPTRPEEDVSHLLEKVKGAAVYASPEELLAHAEYDIVAVNGWFCDSADISIACMKQGIPVYSEKPLATSLPKLSELSRIYGETKSPLGCMLDGPSRGWFRAVQRAVQAGEIGEIRMLHAQKSYRMGTRGAVYRRIETYGGMLPWVGIHGVNWVCRLLQKPVLSFSAASSDAHNRGNGEMETAAALLLQFQGGEIATVTADFLRPVASARHDDDRLRVTGTKGMIEAIDGRVFLENDLPRRELPVPEDSNPFADFVRKLQTGETDADAREAIESTRICLSARDAS